MSRHHRALALLSITTLLLTSFTVLELAPAPFRPQSQQSVSAWPTSPNLKSADAIATAVHWSEQIRDANARPSLLLLGEISPPGDQVAGLPASPAADQQPMEPVAADSDPATANPPIAAAPQPTASRLPVIEYHYSTFYFDGVRMRTEWYVEQLEWLAANGYHTLTIDELADFIDGTYAPPQRSVALTFDVGISHFDDYREVVIPTLRRLGLHGIFFVQPGGVKDECDGEYACWPALAEWLAEGLISVGSHTVTHRDFATLSPAEIAYELAGSQQIIERELGVKVIGVCYPFDSVSPAAYPILESLGYRFAVAGYSRSDRSVHAGEPQPYALPRVYPYSSDSIYPAISGAGGQTFPELIEAALSN